MGAAILTQVGRFRASTLVFDSARAVFRQELLTTLVLFNMPFRLARAPIVCTTRENCRRTGRVGCPRISDPGGMILFHSKSFWALQRRGTPNRGEEARGRDRGIKVSSVRAPGRCAFFWVRFHVVLLQIRPHVAQGTKVWVRLVI